MVARLLLWLIRLYQVLLSPFLGGQCRFYPSCSRYAYACIEGHGALRGALLSAVRLCKCHPFHPGGHDPPPPVPGKREGLGGEAAADATALVGEPVSALASASAEAAAAKRPSGAGRSGRSDDVRDAHPM